MDIKQVMMIKILITIFI